MLEPLHAAQNEEDTGECDGSACEEDAVAGSQQPERGREQYQNAEPCELPGGAADGVGGDGKGQPANGRPRGGGLQSAPAAIQAKNNGEETVDVTHEGDREQKIKG